MAPFANAIYVPGQIDHVHGLKRLFFGLRKNQATPGWAAMLPARWKRQSNILTQFKPGDEMFGISHTGSLAEYAVTPERALLIKPPNVIFI